MSDSIRERIINEAVACLGQTDSVPFIREAAPAYAPGDRPSWCGIFVRAMWLRAGLIVPPWVIGSSNIGYLRETRNPQPGDLIQWRGKAGHQSIFERFDGEYSILCSIDGNVAVDCNYRVARKRRPRSEVLAYYTAPVDRVRDTEPAPPPSVPPSGETVRPAAGLTLGVDVSAYQAPDRMNWEQLRALGYSFAYIRGVRMGREVDVNAVAHVARARAAGMRVGLYAFFVPTIPSADQCSVMLDAHQACGMRPGDLAPALDLESYGANHSGPAWVGPAVSILDYYTTRWGAAVRYHNVADWHGMGRPAALQRFPLWLADYTPPADLPCAIWQVRSAPIQGYGSTPLDQNVAHGELPTIGRSDLDVAIREPIEDAYHRIREAAGRILEYVR